MLVNLEPFGRLGNRLFLDLHLSAYCWKHNVPLRNVALDAYAPVFPGLADIKAPTMGVRLRAWMPGSRHFRYWGTENLDFDANDPVALSEPLLRGKYVYFHGWLFRGFASVARFRNKILIKYRPSELIDNAIAPIIDRASEGGHTVVGVHVRWEDYRGTDAFLNLEEYIKRMQTVSELFAPRRVIFLVFSNEPLNEDSFNTLNVMFPRGTPEQDLYTMAKCDYLIGPPSTFSGWASFYGEVPLATLHRDREKLALTDFSIVKG